MFVVFFLLLHIITCTSNLIPPSQLLLIHTIDGKLTAIDKNTGIIRWTRQEDPPIILEQSEMYFLPNPRDGSLYSNSRHGLTKLKATIPSLSISPPRITNDNLIYSGSKQDSWIHLDLTDGHVFQDDDRIIHMHHQIPKIKYNIVVRSGTKIISNVTFNEYYAHDSTFIASYGLRHFSSNFDGTLVTYKAGKLHWKAKADSIIANIYLLDDPGLISIPFATLEHESLVTLINGDHDCDHNYQPMVYIQRSDYGYYCLPILAERKSVNNYARLTDSLQNGGLIIDYSHVPTYDLNDLFVPDKTKWSSLLYMPIILTIITLLSIYLIKKKHNSTTKEEIIGNHIKVGRLLYNPNEILGRGCDGTVVFKGRFDKRDVAVKRLLRENYVIFEREIKLLLECDSHPHVCRYYFTEECDQFCYIALEYCLGTLNDYIEGRFNITVATCLHQISLGVQHLHSLNIVHRDLKPENILVTSGDKFPQRIVISDFGLCRQFDAGSVTCSSKVGTDGWMAPEVMNGSRVTSAVDVFSLGCVFYYVLTGGSHPFGDAISRQRHILEDRGMFDRLSVEHDNVVLGLIRKMTCYSCKKRPSVHHVVAHPYFWNGGKILSFLIETSDRIDRLDGFDPLVRRLETNNSEIIKENWTEHICMTLKFELGRFRTYKGRNLRDLLRAIRNKRNHYMELPEDVKEALGQVPDEFVRYFTNRFPFLLSFVYEAMEVCADEPNFKQFYIK